MAVALDAPTGINEELIQARLNQSEFTFSDLQKISMGTFLYPDSPQLPGADGMGWRLFDRIYGVEKNDDTGGVMFGEFTPNADHAVLKDHFPNLPVFPGYYLVDHLLQMTGFLIGCHGVRGQGFARGGGECKFTKPVTPDVNLVTFYIQGKEFTPTKRMTTLVADGYWEADGKQAGVAKDIKVVVMHPKSDKA